MAFSSVGVRNTTWILKVGTNIVVWTLKTLATMRNIISDGSC
ncbi:hypothetical protein GBN25_06495 [Plesiomonas shigelloides]|nr:hypothetical protein GBN25_06495 [Plesiomonas shigelloides]